MYIYCKIFSHKFSIYFKIIYFKIHQSSFSVMPIWISTQNLALLNSKKQKKNQKNKTAKQLYTKIMCQALTSFCSQCNWNLEFSIYLPCIFYTTTTNLTVTYTFSSKIVYYLLNTDIQNNAYNSYFNGYAIYETMSRRIIGIYCNFNCY